MQKLLLIDGNAILYRAYHAYPTLTNPKGEFVNAIYGFFTMLFLVLEDQKPEYLAVCFDRAAPTFRQTLFAGYHENRQPPPDDLISQMHLIRELLRTMKVEIFELDGYEGDDLIGTIATKAVVSAGPDAPHPAPTSSEDLPAGARAGDPSRVTHSQLNPTTAPPRNTASDHTNELEVVILTGDRDLLQLVNPQVKVMMPQTGITKTVMYDEAAVEEKYGVHPSQFVDYKALIGDPSDGYPGVTGIGPKTASKLLQEFKTFENLYEKIGELPEKIGLKLATDAEQSALAKKLAQIITDAPIQFDLADCACADFDIAALRKTFKEHEFNSLLKRLDTQFGKEQEQLGLL
ncbi:MAG: 5'-3' exonuclease H3TH domain-containing protein [Patescibacteria group bacterium]